MSEAWIKVKLSILSTSIFVIFHSRFIFLPEDPRGRPHVTVGADWQLAFWFFPALILCGGLKKLAQTEASCWPVDCTGIPPSTNSFLFAGTILELPSPPEFPSLSPVPPSKYCQDSFHWSVRWTSYWRNLVLASFWMYRHGQEDFSEWEELCPSQGPHFSTVLFLGRRHAVVLCISSWHWVTC